jgi:hypothetical protein
MRRHPVRQVEANFIDITPTPAFWRVIAFDHRVTSRMKVLRCVAIGRIITTTDVTACPAKPQMEPNRSYLEAFFATGRARHDITDASNMTACDGHDDCPLPQ